MKLMKNRRKGLIAILLIGMACINLTFAFSKGKVILGLENIEALFSGESDRFSCSGSGTVECYHSYAKAKIIF